MNLSKFNSCYKSDCGRSCEAVGQLAVSGVQVQDLATRADIDEEERERRRKKLMEEVAAGVVGAGVLALAGYEAYEHFDSNSSRNQAIDDGEQRSSWF